MYAYNSQPSTKLNRIASIMHYAKTEQKDELGQYPVIEAEYARVWAGVTPQTGSMLNNRQADTVLTKTTHKVTIRHMTGLSEDMWLMIDGVRYDILYIINPYLSNETCEIFCEVKKYG